MMVNISSPAPKKGKKSHSGACWPATEKAYLVTKNAAGVPVIAAATATQPFQWQGQYLPNDHVNQTS